ncbi:MAG: DUF3775 domain-containing protein [Roseiarcus sp.]|uniref:DUF3775 domain-containing protein n=1 Tax=Candidatus Binatus sp. TaxID=2811406 RepID=UPI003BAFD0CC
MVEIPELSISPETVRAIISMARRFDAKDAVTDPDPGSNGTDDGMLEVLEDHADDPVRAEITTFIHDLNVDEQVDLVALTWLGRGDGDLDNWDDLRAEASRAHNNRTASYLLGTPLLADYLGEALSLFGQSCDDPDAERL